MERAQIPIKNTQILEEKDIGPIGSLKDSKTILMNPRLVRDDHPDICKAIEGDSEPLLLPDDIEFEIDKVG